MYKNLPRYYDGNEFTNGDLKLYEATLTKKSQKQNIPLMIGCSVFDDSKLKMYQFYYDFVDKYIDRSNFQYLEMDTDSAYMALTDNFENSIKPELRKGYEKEKYNWFCRNDNEKVAAQEKRITGKIKIKYKGDSMICLCSKSYMMWENNKFKSSCKNAQKRRNNYKVENYYQCLMNEECQPAINKGFKLVGNQMMTYVQHKIGSTPLYNKGVLLNKLNIASIDT